jgi:uncharacterized protein YjbI with pentapeptide repeats
MKGELMADQSHLGVLSQGLKNWRKWREHNPSTRPDLSEADLSGTDLSGAFLSQANLSGADLSGADLSDASLSEAILSGADLSGAFLTRAFLNRANLTGTQLFVLRPDLRNADLSETTNLTQEQIKLATGNEQTKLPDHLHPPASWSQNSPE